MPQVNDYVKASKQNILVFAESKAIKDKLKPYEALIERCVSRENLHACDAVMFFDYPADRETLDRIMAETSPKCVHLMNYEIKYFDDEEFLKTFSGMLKFAANNNGGKVELLRCASHLGKSIKLIELMFNLFEEAGFIEILEKTSDYYTIKFNGISNLEGVLHNSKFALVMDMAEECTLFQKSLLEDDTEALALV